MSHPPRCLVFSGILVLFAFTVAVRSAPAQTQLPSTASPAPNAQDVSVAQSIVLTYPSATFGSASVTASNVFITGEISGQHCIGSLQTNFGGTQDVIRFASSCPFASGEGVSVAFDGAQVVAPISFQFRVQAATTGGGAFIHKQDVSLFAGTSPLDPGLSLGLDAADMDGDGDLDVIVADRASGTLRLFHNDGTGQMTEVTPAISLSGLIDCAFFIKDPAGTALGVRDVLVTRTDGMGQHFLELLPNSGTGGLTLPNPLIHSSLTAARREIAVADLDHDGDQDVVVSIGGGGATEGIDVIQNTPSGSPPLQLLSTLPLHPMGGSQEDPGPLVLADILQLGNPPDYDFDLVLGLESPAAAQGGLVAYAGQTTSPFFALTPTRFGVADEGVRAVGLADLSLPPDNILDYVIAPTTLTGSSTGSVTYDGTNGSVAATSHDALFTLNGEGRAVVVGQFMDTFSGFPWVIAGDDALNVEATENLGGTPWDAPLLTTVNVQTGLGSQPPAPAKG